MTVDVASDGDCYSRLAKVRETYGTKISSVIHLAAYYSFEGGSYSNYEKITVKGTERLSADLQDFQVTNYFTSTMLIHKPVEVGQRINEDSAIEPTWAYPKSKVETEAVIRNEHGNIPYVILRIAGVYDDHCHSIPISNRFSVFMKISLKATCFLAIYTWSFLCAYAGLNRCALANR